MSWTFQTSTLYGYPTYVHTPLHPYTPPQSLRSCYLSSYNIHCVHRPSLLHVCIAPKSLSLLLLVILVHTYNQIVLGCIVCLLIVIYIYFYYFIYSVVLIVLSCLRLLACLIPSLRLSDPNRILLHYACLLGRVGFLTSALTLPLAVATLVGLRPPSFRLLSAVAVLLPCLLSSLPGLLSYCQSCSMFI